MALSDSHDEGRFPTEYEARGGYRDEINRLREIDLEDPVATHLEDMLVRLSEKEEKDQARAETVSAGAQARNSKCSRMHKQLSMQPTLKENRNVSMN